MSISFTSGLLRGLVLNLPANFKIKVMPFPLFWTQLRISWEMLFNPVDTLFIPASALPIIYPKKSVVVIHDIAWRYFPESFTWFMRKYLHWSTRFAVRHAKRIIAVSESTKKDVVKFYNADASKVVVIHHGYESPSPLPSPLEGEGGVRGLPNKYILFLSTLQPRKNLEGLIDAFRLLKNEHPELEQKLIVVGKPGWKYDAIIRKIEENKDLILYLNHVSMKTG